MANTKTPNTQPFPKQTPASDAGKPASELIDARIAELGDWRGELLARLRAVIRSADDGIIEEWKWNTPVWSCSGIICTGETYKKAVKLTFAKGASIADPSRLFNSSLEGNVRRAIDFADGAPVDEAALRALVMAAVELNRAAQKAKPKRGRQARIPATVSEHAWEPHQMAFCAAYPLEGASGLAWRGARPANAI